LVIIKHFWLGIDESTATLFLHSLVAQELLDARQIEHDLRPLQAGQCRWVVVLSREVIGTRNKCAPSGERANTDIRRVKARRMGGTGCAYRESGENREAFHVFTLPGTIRIFGLNPPEKRRMGQIGEVRSIQGSSVLAGGQLNFLPEG
jgi:hypothetical protein